MSEKIKNANITGGAASQLQSVPGGPSPGVIAETNTQAQNAQQSKNYVVVEGANQGSNEYPYVPFAPDPYDNIANIKRAAAPVVGGNPQYTVAFDKDDAEYLLRQRAQVENADYDRWVMQKYDLTDPAQNFLMQQIAPDQFQRRLDLIDYQQALVSKYARIRLLGAKSQDDLRFEWLVETGRIELPKGPIWDPVAWMDKQTGALLNGAADEAIARTARSLANRKRFTAGLFNPLQYPNEDQVGWQPNRNNRSDPRGNKLAGTVGQIFTGVNGANPYKNIGLNPFSDLDGTALAQANNVAGNRFGFGRTYTADGVPTNIDEGAFIVAQNRASQKGYGN
jgi:hypothetical protein